MGRFLGELVPRLDDSDCVPWLQRECHLDLAAAKNLRDYVRRQRERTGVVPTERRIVVEASRDQLGDWQVILLSPLGNRVHLGLRLALEHRLRQRLGYSPQILHHNNGLLLRLTDSDEPILDIFEGITLENVRERIVQELADSALFALRFRQNAARALLLPRLAAGKRAPLWLQRLRGRDLLQVARQHADFPIVAETFRECLQDHLDLTEVEQFLADMRGGAIEVATCRLETPSPFAADLLFAFTAAYMYQYDTTDAGPAGGVALDSGLLDNLLGAGKQRLILPQAVAQVDSRLRGTNLPPRSATEMAEWLRRLGDLTPAELQGPMAEFLEELKRDGRAVEIELSVALQPRRFVLAEEVESYRQAFGLAAATFEQQTAAAEIILERFLNTHALIGLDDVLARYPLERQWAQRKLEQWAGSGRAVVVAPAGESAAVQWSAPANLEQVRRSTLALLRQEVVTCPPQQFADFQVRWQGVHPETRRQQHDGLTEVLASLEAVALPAELWERSILPARVTGYQANWLDDCLASGQWLWTGKSGEGEGETETEGRTPAVSFLHREHLADLPPPTTDESSIINNGVGQVLEFLRARGASFVGDMASQTGLMPGAIRTALWELVRRGLVTNDRFDPVRKGPQPAPPSPTPATARSLMRGRMRAPLLPEGRWSLLPWGQPDSASQALFLTNLLLRRHGIAARELALMDARMLPWRVLYEVLSRLEMTGEVRRGYFVEGLSGAQFALPEAARMLQETATPSTANAPAVLLHTLDPANLYGSGAPLDIPLLDGGTRPLLRRAGNWLVLRAAGRC